MQGGGGAGVPGEGELQRLPFAHAAAQPARRDSLSLTHSLSLSAPLCASPRQSTPGFWKGRGWTMQQGVDRPPPSSIHHPSTLPVCVVLKRLSSESHNRTVLRIVHTAGARPIEGDRELPLSSRVAPKALGKCLKVVGGAWVVLLR